MSSVTSASSPLSQQQIKPSNSLVTPLLTDLYQLTMTYAHWKNSRHEEHAVFELFFRKNPFKGSYTIFCGLDEVISHVKSFKFTQDDIDYLKVTPALQHCESNFFDEYLLQLDCSKIRIHALQHGSLAFPRVPLLVVSGPLGVGQLLETTLLTLVNYPSLLATNASRMVLQATDYDKIRLAQQREQQHQKDLPQQCHKVPKCIEFGLRRAQGPDGGFSASKYAYIGGFDATSNVKAGKELKIPIAGTHAHAFVQSYLSLEEVKDLTLCGQKEEEEVNLLSKVLEYRNTLLLAEEDEKKDNSTTTNDVGGGSTTTSTTCFQKTNDGELAAFVAYGCAFPHSFLCLVDTYDTLNSGLLNFCLVALALHDLGYQPRGIRLDSGDLAALSLSCATRFNELARSLNRPFFHELDIVASNDINEKSLIELNRRGHAITVYGIGTNLVTCQAQPALGCVYKLVELNGIPRLKLSQEPAKVLIPGRKIPYRLFGKDGAPLVDLLIDSTKDEPPVAGNPVLCRNPFQEMDRVLVTPSRVIQLHGLYFDGDATTGGQGQQKSIAKAVGSLQECKDFVSQQLQNMPAGLLGSFAIESNSNSKKQRAAQYPVTVSDNLYKFLHSMWQEQLPVKELS